MSYKKIRVNIIIQGSDTILTNCFLTNLRTPTEGMTLKADDTILKVTSVRWHIMPADTKEIEESDVVADLHCIPFNDGARSLTPPKRLDAPASPPSYGPNVMSAPGFM